MRAQTPLLPLRSNFCPINVRTRQWWNGATKRPQLRDVLTRHWWKRALKVLVAAALLLAIAVNAVSVLRHTRQLASLTQQQDSRG